MTDVQDLGFSANVSKFVAIFTTFSQFVIVGGINQTVPKKSHMT